MMGWRPHELRATLIPEFLACFDGFARMHGMKKAVPVDRMTKGRLAELMAEYPDGD